MSTEQKNNPSQAASRALNTITSQIRLLADMPADSCKMAVAGLEPIVNANFKMVVDACNEQVDEFNALIDELERRDQELNTSEAARASLREQVADAGRLAEEGKSELRLQLEQLEAELFNAQREANSAGSKLEASKVTVRQLERELKTLKEMDPAGMKNRIKEKDKTLEELRAAIVKHKVNEKSYRDQILGLEARIKEMIGVANSQDAELSRRAEAIAELEQNREVKAAWYRYFNQTFYGEDGVGWNVYIVDHGLRSTMSYLINDLNWKVHAMRQDGGGCVVMIGQWLHVVYAKPWGDKAPKEMTETINAFMLEVLAKSHPHLQARAEWAQTVSIHELGLSARIITLLEGAELDTLYKVMSHQGGKLDNVKGLGEKLVGQVIYACELAVKAWEQEHISAEEAA